MMVLSLMVEKYFFVPALLLQLQNCAINIYLVSSVLRNSFGASLFISSSDLGTISIFPLADLGTFVYSNYSVI